MAYEIPQQLQYEEKIIFGLTFNQLIYASIFIFPAIVIFMKTHLNLYFKIFLATLLISFGCLFMFFNFSSYLKNLISWLQFREISLADPKMKEFFAINKIENGVIYVSKTKAVKETK